MPKITFLVAMAAEAAPLIEHFGLQPLPPFSPTLPMRGYTGNYGAYQISLVVNGKDAAGLDLIGCEAATLATHIAITTFAPELLINAGTAGGFIAHGAEIGDVYLSHQHIVFHDRRVDVPGWDKMGQGYFPTLDGSRIAPHIGCKSGICTSGSSLDMTPHDYDQMRQTGGEVKDMEVAAIAWVAQLHHTPLLALKSITDLVDSGRPTNEEFDQNLHLASLRLKEACFRLIESGLLEKFI